MWCGHCTCVHVQVKGVVWPLHVCARPGEGCGVATARVHVQVVGCGVATARVHVQVVGCGVTTVWCTRVCTCR